MSDPWSNLGGKGAAKELNSQLNNSGVHKVDKGSVVQPGVKDYSPQVVGKIAHQADKPGA